MENILAVMAIYCFQCVFPLCPCLLSCKLLQFLQLARGGGRAEEKQPVRHRTKHTDCNSEQMIDERFKGH